MDRDYFLNARTPLPLMPTWNLISPLPEKTSDRFLHQNWEKSTDQFDSALSSMVSSPVASNSAVSNDTFAIRELIGKLGNICNSGEISPQFLNASCYGTPLNSLSKLNLPIMDQFVKENLPNLGNSVPLNSNLPSLAEDPGFAERAAKFYCFGSRSFNGRTRTSQFGLNNNSPEFQFRSTVPLIENGNGKLPRVSSSPLLKVDGSPMEVQDKKNLGETHMKITSGSGSDKKFSRLSGSAANSNDESTVSEQIPSGEIGLKSQNDSNSRKRKGASRGKAKEIASATKVAEANDDSNAKRFRQTDGGKDNGGTETEEETKSVNNGAKNTPKPPEPPKDYIHVRARRGQATDSHSLAERVRREKISERMKFLQDLVPGCNKVTGKALMLDEIINYVQSLQRQVEFLSMKLVTVNPRLDFDMNSLLSKDKNQSDGTLPNQMYPMESSASAFYGQQPQQNQQVHNNIFDGAVSQCSLDLLPPPVHGFTENFPQFPTFCEDDLQSIVQMGFGETLNRDTTFQPQSFHAQNQASQMKIEL